MKITAKGMRRSVRGHAYEYHDPTVDIKSPTTPDDTMIVISGYAFHLSLGGDFKMQVHMPLQEFCTFVRTAAQSSEAVSSMLKAAVYNGDAVRAGNTKKSP